MRLVASIPAHPQYKRAMICQKQDGVYFFLYTSEEDSHCQHDYWFEQFADAIQYGIDHFGIEEKQWRKILDTVPGYFDDYIHPVPMKSEARKQALIQAADGEFEWVKALLSAGADSNGMPLIMAIQCDEPEIVKAMINSGADVNFDFANTTPLIRAISGTHPKIVEILIEAGADINKKASNGDSPLQVAMLKNRINATEEERKAIVQLLESAKSKA
jgi:hypothetical protein